FTYTPDSSFTGTDRFTYIVDDGSGTGPSDPATVTIVSLNRPLDTDGDGVPDFVEAFVPPTNRLIDGNSDGAPDYLEQNVASLPAADGRYWTLVGSGDVTQGQGFVHVDNVTPNSQGLPPVPAGLNVPAGLFRFQIKNLPQGSSADVRLIAPSSTDGANGFVVY